MIGISYLSGSFASTSVETAYLIVVFLQELRKLSPRCEGRAKEKEKEDEILIPDLSEEELERFIDQLLVLRCAHASSGILRDVSRY